jgi:hypothetical protein
MWHKGSLAPGYWGGSLVKNELYQCGQGMLHFSRSKFLAHNSKSYSDAPSLRRFFPLKGFFSDTACPDVGQDYR